MRLPNNCIWSSFDSHPVVCAIIDLLLKWEYHVWCFDGRFLTFAARVEAINYWRRRDRSRCSWLITICFRNNSATWRHLKASPVSQSALPALHYPCPYPTQPSSSRSRTDRSWLRHQSRDTVAAELLPVYLLRRRLSHGHPAMQQRVAVCDKFNSHFAHLLQKRDNRHFHPLLLLLLPIVLAVDGRDMARIAHHREGALQTVITENNSNKSMHPLQFIEERD